MIFNILLGIGALLIITAIMIPIFKTTYEVYPYAYSNARIRSKKSTLLKKQDFERLLSKSYNEILYYIEKKNLIEDLTKYSGGDFSYGSLDGALRNHLINDLRKVKRISPSSTTDFINVFLSKYDILIIEAIIRSGKSQINIKDDLVHVSQLFSENFLRSDKLDYNKLYNELKGTEYIKLLDLHEKDIKNKKYKKFELALDKLYFKKLKSKANTLELKKYVKTIVDIHNIALALKNEKDFVEGGSINPKTLSNKTSEIINIAKKYYKINASNEIELERELQYNLLNLANTMMSRNPLSDALIIGYIILKTINIRNLNILLKMKYENFDEEEIRKVLVI